MLADYSGVILGKYAGTLYCLRHDFSGAEADKALCQKEGRHVHVLVMKKGYVHPLYGVNERVHTQIHADALHGKSVKIKGKFSPTSNAILVSKVTLAEGEETQTDTRSEGSNAVLRRELTPE